jgi:hypothetical protein
MGRWLMSARVDAVLQLALAITTGLTKPVTNAVGGANLATLKQK